MTKKKPVRRDRSTEQVDAAAKRAEAAEAERLAKTVASFVKYTLGGEVPRDLAVERYWLSHYVTDHCTLCGNSGRIDTTASAVTPTGKHVGRVNFCICPNGQTLRWLVGHAASPSTITPP